MISQELQKKIDRSIRLLRSIKVKEGEKIEVAYSGGKDSDVILQLAKEAGIPYRAIYRCTTIDPPGTIKHVLDNGVEIRRPKTTFFKMIEQKGLPSRFHRFCCSELKEFKILDECVMGVRREESAKRAKRYTEPTVCRFYGSKKNHVKAIFPILDWTNEDILAFVEDRGIELHPLYKRIGGGYDVSKRLGCVGCPLASRKKRIEELKEYPKMVRQYIRSLRNFRNTHPNSRSLRYHKNEYEQFVFSVFFNTKEEFDTFVDGMFGRVDCKKFLEDYFKVKLD